MNLEELENILTEFDNFPIKSPEPTFLEICKYPRSRFEEICSRILCFFFKPSNEHGFNDLFLNSILEILSPQKIPFKNDQIKVINEENAEGKRIDILIHSPDFVIGIENKINAKIYNPLEIYKTRIERYSTSNIFKVILSLRKNLSSSELAFLDKNEFLLITYSQLFEVIKKNIGNYIVQGNKKYLIHLYDFIQTIENMSEGNLVNEKLSNFFFDNSKKIDSLLELYEKDKNRISEIQNEKIAELKEKIINLTKNDNWWAWKGWDLGFNSFNPNKAKIGIESSFKQTRGNPLGKFRIYITTWDLKDWTPYEKELMDMFPDSFLDKENNRAFFHMDILDGKDEEIILKKLKEYYEVLSKMTSD